MNQATWSACLLFALASLITVIACHGDDDVPTVPERGVRTSFEVTVFGIPALELEGPEALDDFIVAHPMVWTFTHPLVAVRHSDQVSIRTNCAGRLTYQIDDMATESRSLAEVGGVMAGARRFQDTLGPFPTAAKRLTFQFHCEHPGCDGPGALLHR